MSSCFSIHNTLLINIYSQAISRVVAKQKWDFSHYECIISSTEIVQYSSYASICAFTSDISYGMDCM